MQSPYNGGGYPGPPQPASGMSSLTIVLLVLGGMMVLGGGACAVGALYMLGAVSSEPAGVKTAPTKPGKPEATEPADEPVPDPEEDPASPAQPPEKPPSAPAKVGPPAPASSAKKGRRTVDFVCPPGKPPAGTVRAGCMCGSEILGTACGSGGFTDVVATAKGCRFTCE